MPEYLDYRQLVDYAAEDAAGRGGLSYRPEYYSGRGVNRGDLNETHLQRIHTALKKHHGAEVAAAFVRMVKSLSDLSATNFLNQLQAFCGNGGKWGDAPVGRESGLDVGPAGPGREAVALGTLASVLFGPTPAANRVATEDMKQRFLLSIGEPLEKRSRSYADGPYPYPDRIKDW